MTVRCNETTRELLSLGDFMERLIYNTAIHAILPVPPDPPLCLSRWASSSLSPFIPLLTFSFLRCASHYLLFFSLKHPASPATRRDEPSKARMEGDWARPRHWQSSETQQGCEQLNIERLFGAVMMSQAREERRGKWGGKRRAARLRGSSHTFTGR